MLIRVFILASLLVVAIGADKPSDVVSAAMSGLSVVGSEEPYSRVIQRVYIGWDADGNP